MDDPEDTGDDFDEIEDFDETEEEGVEPEAQQDDEETEPEEDEQPVRKPSRAESRIEALSREVREARERAEAAERRANEILNGQSRTSHADAEREEQARLAQMDPWDRAEYLRRKDRDESARQIEALRRESAEATDRAEFAQACASNPALAKVKDKVETELAKLRAQGQTVPRQTLAAFLIGQQLLEKAPKARERTAKRAANNLDRERTRPAHGASDAPRGGGKDEKAARDKRLENFTF
jgi:hypothetical protein